MKEEIIGTKGLMVDLFNKELTQEEWNALCIIHRMTNRLNIGVRFDYTKSIDVRSEKYSQIIDESVYLDKEIRNLNIMSDQDKPIEKLRKIPTVSPDDRERLNEGVDKPQMYHNL